MLSLQAEVEVIANDWATLWNESDEYHCQWPELGNKLDDLLVHELRYAANTFRPSTGLGVDIISPKAWLRLPDAALRSMSRILSAAEHLGEWPSYLSLALIVLLPKSDGGRRPIVLFSTMLRV